MLRGKLDLLANIAKLKTKRISIKRDSQQCRILQETELLECEKRLLKEICETRRRIYVNSETIKGCIGSINLNSRESKYNAMIRKSKNLLKANGKLLVIFQRLLEWDTNLPGIKNILAMVFGESDSVITNLLKPKKRSIKKTEPSLSVNHKLICAPQKHNVSRAFLEKQIGLMVLDHLLNTSLIFDKEGKEDCFKETIKRIDKELATVFYNGDLDIYYIHMKVDLLKMRRAVEHGFYSLAEKYGLGIINTWIISAREFLLELTNEIKANETYFSKFYRIILSCITLFFYCGIESGQADHLHEYLKVSKYILHEMDEPRNYVETFLVFEGLFEENVRPLLMCKQEIINLIFFVFQEEYCEAKAESNKKSPAQEMLNDIMNNAYIARTISNNAFLSIHRNKQCEDKERVTEIDEYPGIIETLEQESKSKPRQSSKNPVYSYHRNARNRMIRGKNPIKGKSIKPIDLNVSLWSTKNSKPNDLNKTANSFEFSKRRRVESQLLSERNGSCTKRENRTFTFRKDSCISPSKFSTTLRISTNMGDVSKAKPDSLIRPVSCRSQGHECTLMKDIHSRALSLHSSLMDSTIRNSKNNMDRFLNKMVFNNLEGIDCRHFPDAKRIMQGEVISSIHHRQRMKFEKKLLRFANKMPTLSIEDHVNRQTGQIPLLYNMEQGVAFHKQTFMKGVDAYLIQKGYKPRSTDRSSSNTKVKRGDDIKRKTSIKFANILQKVEDRENAAQLILQKEREKRHQDALREMEEQGISISRFLQPLQQKEEIRGQSTERVKQDIKLKMGQLKEEIRAQEKEIKQLGKRSVPSRIQTSKSPRNPLTALKSKNSEMINSILNSHSKKK